jgi:hypothetical protein
MRLRPSTVSMRKKQGKNKKSKGAGFGFSKTRPFSLMIQNPPLFLIIQNPPLFYSIILFFQRLFFIG